MANASGTLAGLPLLGLEEVPDDYGRWLIHGPQGAGKTTIASTIAALGPTLFLDLTGEKGIRSFRGATYSDNITIIRPTSLQQFNAIYEALDRGTAVDRQGRKIVAVVIDSFTAVQKMAMRFILGHSENAAKEIMKNGSPADQRSWGQTLDIMADFATFWYALADGNRQAPIHVVFTAQTKIVEDEVGGITSRSPDVQKGAMGIIKAAPDYILYAEAEENFDVIDDEGTAAVRHIARFGVHPGYSTKARIPVRLRGKMPPVIGRAPVNPENLAEGYKSPDLAQLSRVLGIGGVPKAAPAARPAAASAPAA